MIKNYLDKFNLRRKKAVIFGGCGLIGKKITEAFISADAELTIIDIDDKTGKNLKEKFKTKNFKFIKFDVSKIKNLDRFVYQNFKKKNCPEIFVNCTYPVTKNWNKSSFKKNKLTILRKNIDIHLNSHSWLAYKFCDLMKKSGVKGSIIIFNSIYGIVGQNMNLYNNTKISENMNYSIIKGGLSTLTKQLASYYGKYGIRVNALCSGGVLGHVKNLQRSQDKKFINNYSKLCPLGRLANPDEIALPTLFLASDASKYITGTNFMVDGGWTAI